MQLGFLTTVFLPRQTPFWVIRSFPLPLGGPPILGMNVMAKYGLTLDPISGRISLPSQVPPLEKSQDNTEW